MGLPSGGPYQRRKGFQALLDTSGRLARLGPSQRKLARPGQPIRFGTGETLPLKAERVALSLEASPANECPLFHFNEQKETGYQQIGFSIYFRSILDNQPFFFSLRSG